MIYVTVVVPAGNTSPGSCELLEMMASQVGSGVGGVHVTAASHAPGAAVTSMSFGQFKIIGMPVLVTVTSKLHINTFPPESVPAYVTVVVPVGKSSPGSKLLVKVTKSQLLSKVGGSQETEVAVHEPASASTEILGGQTKVGSRCW